MLQPRCHNLPGHGGIESDLPQCREHFPATDHQGQRCWRKILHQFPDVFPEQSRVEEFRKADLVFHRGRKVFRNPPFGTIGQKGSRETIVVLFLLEDLHDPGWSYALCQSLFDLVHEGLDRKPFLLCRDGQAEKPFEFPGLESMFIAERQHPVQGNRWHARVLSLSDGAREVDFRPTDWQGMDATKQDQYQCQSRAESIKSNSHFRFL